MVKPFISKAASLGHFKIFKHVTVKLTQNVNWTSYVNSPKLISSVKVKIFLHHMCYHFPEHKCKNAKQSYYKSSNVCLFVCLSVCLFVPYLLRGPLTDHRQTWWVYVGGPRNCPWGVLFRKRQRLDGSTGHFHFPLYYICASLTPHSCKRRLCCYCI